VVPFFTASLTAEHLERARAAVASKGMGMPLRLLYVGRLSANKNVDILLDSLDALRRQGVSVRCTIIGDGPERQALEERARTLGVTEIVSFTGALDFERVVTSYEQHDVLVLASDSEGWPKAIAEGMAFGLVCVGSDRGFVIEMLGEGRGVPVPPRDVKSLVEAIARIAQHPAEYDTMRRRAAQWAQRYSLTDVREALRDLLREWWGVPIHQRSGCA
jgi:glycosyltransferase involved in cell wall biosynthesis